MLFPTFARAATSSSLPGISHHFSETSVQSDTKQRWCALTRELWASTRSRPACDNVLPVRSQPDETAQLNVLLTPTNCGGLALKNRVVYPAMTR